MSKCDFSDYRGWSGYYCMKKEDYINTDTYNRYCNSYSYDQCPIYKQSSGSSGCYLTTACVEIKNMPDNCKELNVLRRFRDDYILKQPKGIDDIKEYYKTAPQIVEKIDVRSNRKEIYEDLYLDVMKPCVELIENGKNEEAYLKYKSMVKNLEKEYI